MIKMRTTNEEEEGDIEQTHISDIKSCFMGHVEMQRRLYRWSREKLATCLFLRARSIPWVPPRDPAVVCDRPLSSRRKVGWKAIHKEAVSVKRHSAALAPAHPAQTTLDGRYAQHSAGAGECRPNCGSSLHQRSSTIGESSTAIGDKTLGSRAGETSKT